MELQTCRAKTVYPQTINVKPNNKNLDIKAFVDDILDLIKRICPLKTRKTFLENGENAGNRHFLLYPKCFQKFFTSEAKNSVPKKYFEGDMSSSYKYSF